MVFVKFHNMNRKKILMSPLNSNKLKKFHFTTSQNNITITVQKCSVFFSSFFFDLCTVYLKKKVRSFFLFFFFHMLRSTIFKFLFFLFFFFHLHCPVAFFFFLFFSVFIIFFSFFLFIINCSFNVSFFFLTLSLPLSVLSLKL